MTRYYHCHSCTARQDHRASGRHWGRGARGTVTTAGSAHHDIDALATGISAMIPQPPARPLVAAAQGRGRR
jgi:hypothetical protein